MAGGLGGVGAAVGLDSTATAQVLDGGYIDLGATPYDVVAGDESAALTNAAAINQAISDHPTDAHLVLPAGTVYVARDLATGAAYRFAAIRITGTDKQRLVLSGRGSAVTRLVMTGTQHGGLSQIIQIADGPRRITLRDFSIEHGKVTEIDTAGLQNHQIELKAAIATVTDVEIRDIFFGPCIGDGIRLCGSETDLDSSVLVNTRIHHITMRLGKHPATPQGGCRSGVSFQRGIRDLLLSDFYIVGAKNSCLDMEPTAHGVLDNITIANGTVDNTEGTTWVAASFDGFEDGDGVTSFLTHSRMVNVRIKGGQLQVLSTRGCTLDNVVVEANRDDTPDALNAPLLLVARDNEDLALRNIEILRDQKCLAGPLVTVTHLHTSPRRITIEGGTWTTRVGPGKEFAYVDLLDAAALRMRGTRIRAEGALNGAKSAVRIRPGHRDMPNIHLDSVAIEAPDGLTAGIVVAALHHDITNLMVTGCSMTGTATSGILLDAQSGGLVDRFPIIQGNDFARCTNLWSVDHDAFGAVFPIIAGNRGGRCTFTGIAAPESVVAALPGSQYVRQNGELWLKATGTGATGWRLL